MSLILIKCFFNPFEMAPSHHFITTTLLTTVSCGTHVYDHAEPHCMSVPPATVGYSMIN